MDWFKHDSNANLDDKLQEILLDYGLEGYGLYWYCIELIVGKTNSENITFELKHDARVIARNTGSTVTKIEEMMKKFIMLGLFENSDGKITCMKVAKRLSSSSTSNIKMRFLIHSINNNHDGIMTPSIIVMKDKIRKDKNNSVILQSRFDDFWSAYPKTPRKVGKSVCEKKWQAKKLDTFADEIIKHLNSIKNTKQWLDGYEPAPLTYINQERWKDEVHSSSKARGLVL